MSNSISILSTVALDEQLVRKASAHGITLDTAAFINIIPVVDSALVNIIADLCTSKLVVSFTSANAVKAISSIIGSNKPQWTVYCIGHATYSAAITLFGANAVKAAGKNAEELAGAILKDGISELTFFCGDKRMDTLPDILRSNSVQVNELTVYHTTEKPVQIGRSYNGILFYSPSSVSSFFSVNKVNSDTVLFAIGATTASALKERTQNEIVISDTPSRDALVDLAIQYFKQQPVTIGTK